MPQLKPARRVGRLTSLAPKEIRLKIICGPGGDVESHTPSKPCSKSSWLRIVLARSARSSASRFAFSSNSNFFSRAAVRASASRRAFSSFFNCTAALNCSAASLASSRSFCAISLANSALSACSIFSACLPFLLVQPFLSALPFHFSLFSPFPLPPLLLLTFPP